jgi:hypothetical protein
MREIVGGACLLIAVSGGAQEASYVVRGAQLPVAVAANGYVQSVTAMDGDRVQVQVATALVPVGSKGAYGGMQGPVGTVPDDFEIPRALRSKLRGELEAWQVATEVLKWVALHLRIEEGMESQDAATVLARRGGRCSGVANATVALLLAAGFEARTVSGLLVLEEGAVPHRWVECSLPRAGWVPTDPTLGLWAITPQHLAFADTVVDLPEVRVVQPGDGGLERLPNWKGRPMRPNAGSDLVCRLVGEGTPLRAMAVMYGRGGDVRRTWLAPEGRFESLLPGRWRLVVVANGEVIEQRDLLLAPSQSHSFTVKRSLSTRSQEVGS